MDSFPSYRLDVPLTMIEATASSADQSYKYYNTNFVKDVVVVTIIGLSFSHHPKWLSKPLRDHRSILVCVKC